MSDQRPPQRSFHVHLEGSFTVLMDRDGYYIAQVRLDDSNVRISGRCDTPAKAIMEALH